MTLPDLPTVAVSRGRRRKRRGQPSARPMMRSVDRAWTAVDRQDRKVPPARTLRLFDGNLALTFWLNKCQQCSLLLISASLAMNYRG